MSTGDFIKRVELRSSLLMTSGHEVERGILSPVYEFRHLTFQEYLAARAVAFGHYPDRKDTDTLATVLKPYLEVPSWNEVIPLAAVLAGRSCKPLILELIKGSRDYQPKDSAEEKIITFPEALSVLPWVALARCLSDEAQLQPDLLREAMRCVAQNCSSRESLDRVGESKYGSLFDEIARSIFLERENLLGLGGYFSQFSVTRFGFKEFGRLSGTTAAQITELLDKPDPFESSIGCLAAMHIGYARSRSGSRRLSKRSTKLLAADKKTLEEWLYKILVLTKSTEETVQFSAVWATVWLIDALQWSPIVMPAVLMDFTLIWMASFEKPWGYIAAWILTVLPPVPREPSPIDPRTPGLTEFVVKRAEADERYEKWAAFVVAYYIHAPYTDAQLAEFLSREREFGFSSDARGWLEAALPTTATKKVS
jgi:hypothetical protein